MTDPLPTRDPERIKAMFASVAGGYDRANTVLSGGIHHLWRRKLVRASGARVGMSILDIATGTGDLAIAFKKAVGELGSVSGCDFCPEMLAIARTKAARKGYDINFEFADATALPYADATFDITAMAFGIRNVADPVRALAEMGRVTKPGGIVMVLEFGQPAGALWRWFYRHYARLFIPTVGGLVTGQPEAYAYLEKTSASFPCGAAFFEFVKRSGRLTSHSFQPLTGGIAYLYTTQPKQ